MKKKKEKQIPVTKVFIVCMDNFKYQPEIFYILHFYCNYQKKNPSNWTVYYFNSIMVLTIRWKNSKNTFIKQYKTNKKIYEIK